jgi:hypothetical protein
VFLVFLVFLVLQFCGATEAQLGLLVFKEQEDMLTTNAARLLSDEACTTGAVSLRPAPGANDALGAAAAALPVPPPRASDDSDLPPLSPLASAVAGAIRRSECGMLLMEQLKGVVRKATERAAVAEAARTGGGGGGGLVTTGGGGSGIVVDGAGRQGVDATAVVQELERDETHLGLCDEAAAAFAGGPASRVGG